MVSHPDVLGRLKEFVCVRIDWEQMQKHKSRLRVPTQGNQVVLDPKGNYIPDIRPRGKRYPVEELVALLDRVLAQFPPDPEHGGDLDLSWFLFNSEEHGLPRYAGCEFLARVDRKPLLTVSGEIPAWLERPAFLRKHLRQFVWTRGERSGPPQLTVRQLEPERQVLLDVSLATATTEPATGASKADSAASTPTSTAGAPPVTLGDQLDAAWLEYMKTRPRIARGYIDNPHGNWLRPVLEKVHLEELETEKRARNGTLLPPGRAADAESPASR